MGVPQDFFCRRFDGDYIAIDNCHFRSLRSATQKSRRQVLAGAKILHEFVGVLEEFVDFPVEEISETSRKLAGNMEDIDEFAAEVRKYWGMGLGPIPNLLKLLDFS